MLLVLRVELLEPFLGFLDHFVCVSFTQFYTSSVPDDVGRVLKVVEEGGYCLLYTSPSPRDRTRSRMPSSA